MYEPKNIQWSLSDYYLRTENKMIKVLITGANGFIGKELMRKFKYYKHVVEGCDWGDVDNKQIFRVDLRKITKVVEFLDKSKPDIIIHCAGNADVRHSVQYPEVDYERNVTITHNLLFALHKLGMDRTKVIFLSSASVYGNPSVLPISEDTPTCPLSPYAVHKVMCEKLCEYFINNYKMDIKIARIFSAYGSGLRKQIFWDMHKRFINTGKLLMFGTGNESRDYIHIDDVANSIYLMATVSTPHIIFNVANGEELTIRTVAEIFANKSNIPLENIAFNGIVREGDPLNWRADISKMKEIGYAKSVSIEEGLERYCLWVKNLN